MPYMRYSFTILLTLMTFYGWASPSVAASRFVCRGVGLHEPERSSLWNLSDVSTLDKAGLNRAPRYVATSVYDGDSVRTIISEIIDGRRMRYLVDGSNLIWIGEETPEMHIRVDTLCYTSALLPFGDVSIPLSLHYRSNVIRSDGTLVQSATYYPYGEPHRDPAVSAGIGIAGPDLPMSATAIISNEDNTTLNPYLFHNKRLDLVPRTYEYPLRTYVSAVQYWSSMDPYAERYPHLSPYCSFACNPIRYTDETGGVITVVSAEDQKKFYDAMTKLFNDKAENFSFNNDGQLKYDGDTKGLSRNQKNVLKGLRKVMDSEENTTISFGKSVTIKDENGNDVKFNASADGGAFTILQTEAIEKGFDVSTNIILIDPDATSTQVDAVTDASYGDWSDLSLGVKLETVDVQLNVPDMISHEIGHVLYAGKTQDKVIDFNNKAREILGLPKRRYDIKHYERKR